MPSASPADLSPAFAVGSGRCGTHFLARVFALEPAVASYHERHVLSDSFQRWCVWNRVEVDSAGFLATKEAGFREDRASGRLSFEASAYLSLTTPLLYRAFDARFVLMLRRPDRVVASFLEKGWYEATHFRENPRMPAGYQPNPRQAHHPFTRLAAIGDDGERWSRLSRVGKLAYFWRRINESVLADFALLPREATRIERLEGFDFEKYREAARFIGIEPQVRRAEYERLATLRPGKRAELPGVESWSDSECAEFEAEVAPLAERLGMEWRCEQLRAEATARRTPEPPRTLVKRLAGALRRE
jgi:hypothetical protein